MTTDPLEFGHYYHIYNHGVGSRDLFLLDENYDYFLKLYMQYIVPIADTFAWAFMKNHFHLLLRIKDEAEILDGTNFESILYPSADPNVSIKKPHQYFSNFFNAYAKAINKQTGEKGSLFRRPVKRKLINDELYLKYLVLYIHNNPVHHEICEFPGQYQRSSYNVFFTNQYSFLKCNDVVSWFNARKTISPCTKNGSIT